MSHAAVVVNPTKPDDDEAFRTSVRRVATIVASVHHRVIPRRSG
jgi:hypothetical protein